MLNLRSLKSHEHEIWHVGSLNDVDVQRPSGILIFDFFWRPSWIFQKSPISLYLTGMKSHDHAIWHVGPLSYLDVQGVCEILIFENPRWPPKNIENQNSTRTLHI